MTNTQPEIVLQVSDAVALINQTLDFAYPVIVIEGEISSFKVNQGKFVFFDIKDSGATLGCFMMLFQLRTALEDGMRVQIVAQPKLTQWGKFSLTVREIRPIGEGSLKRAFELLKTKLQKEGLFDDARKRTLPRIPKRIGVISSTAAAGYGDFVKIVGDRWGGVELIVAHVQVQGQAAAPQIMRALDYFNQAAEPVDVVAILRGGGSSDDLAVFNDEPLTRAIAASRIPTIVGVGHEMDVTLADMVADVRASTPSNAAQLVVPDKTDTIRQIRRDVGSMVRRMDIFVDEASARVVRSRGTLKEGLDELHYDALKQFAHLRTVLTQLNPRTVLSRGYALVFAEDGSSVDGERVRSGDRIRVEIKNVIIEAGVTNVTEKSTR